MLFRKNLYDEIVHPNKHTFRWLRAPVLWCLFPLLLLVAFRLICRSTRLSNALIANVTTPIKSTLSALCAHAPFPVAELIWLLAAVVAVLFLLRTIFLLIAKKGRLKRLIRRVLALCSACLIVYVGYCFFWGINYYGDSFSTKAGLTARGCQTEELYTLSTALADRCSQLAQNTPRNPDGTMQATPQDLLPESSTVFQAVQQEFPALEGPVTPARGMLSSRLISYTGFTGFLFPFTGESLVNVDAPVCLLPATALHELAHQRNVASEAEANFVAVVAGLHSENPEYAYSSALLAYIHVSNALYQADPSLWTDARTHLSQDVLADLQANDTYWAAFESPVETVSTTVYDGFLQSYNQRDGMASYGKCVDLLVAYYFDLHPDLLLKAGTL